VELAGLLPFAEKCTLQLFAKTAGKMQFLHPHNPFATVNFYSNRLLHLHNHSGLVRRI
jgi:hypothetical protein